MRQCSYRTSGGLRHVDPYYHTVLARVKSRWIGRSVVDVLADEFRWRTREYYEYSIANESITLADSKGIGIPIQTLQHGMTIVNKMHFHEPPVFMDPEIVESRDGFTVVNKPASMPVHASGRFRCNSAASILQSIHSGPKFHPIHRIDRLVSGLVLFSTDIAGMKSAMRMIHGEGSSKFYLARVLGNFDSVSTTHCITTGSHEFLEQFPRTLKAVLVDTPVFKRDPSLNLYTSDPVLRHTEGDNGKASQTLVTFLEFDQQSNTSLVLCQPLTGRSHQIRVHLQHLGFPIANDPWYGGVFSQGNSIIHNYLTHEEPNCNICMDTRQDMIPGIGEQDPFLNCCEIWLHSLQYNSEQLSFTVPEPIWSTSTYDFNKYLMPYHNTVTN